MSEPISFWKTDFVDFFSINKKIRVKYINMRKNVQLLQLEHWGHARSFDHGTQIQFPCDPRSDKELWSAVFGHGL